MPTKEHLLLTARPCSVLPEAAPPFRIRLRSRRPVALLCLGCVAALAPTLTCAQTPATPKTAVAVENTNSGFSPSDTNVPEASPARPTVTSPAHIPPTGYLQFEQGFNQAAESPGGTRAQFSLNQVTKIALTTRILVQFLTGPYAYSVLSGPMPSGFMPGASFSSDDPGDLQLGGQAIVHKQVGSLPVIALGFIRRVRSGSSANLDTGSYSQSALLLLSGDLPCSFHYDANAIVSEQNNGSVRRPQLGQTFSVTHPLFPTTTQGRLTGTAELSHFTQPFVIDTYNARPADRADAVDLLFAAGYSVHPNLVLDAAFSHGLTSTSTQWQGAFGFTYLLPHRLWPDRHPVPKPVGPFRYANPR